jgi:hypothetical protein
MGSRFSFSLHAAMHEISSWEDIRMRVHLFIAILIFAVASVACQQITAPPAPTNRPQIAASCSTTDGASFAARFVAVNRKVPSGIPLSQAELADLSNAYCNAPATFRRQLDNIDFLFISADPASQPAIRLSVRE